MDHDVSATADRDSRSQLRYLIRVLQDMDASDSSSIGILLQPPQNPVHCTLSFSLPSANLERGGFKEKVHCSAPATKDVATDEKVMTRVTPESGALLLSSESEIEPPPLLPVCRCPGTDSYCPPDDYGWDAKNYAQGFRQDSRSAHGYYVEPQPGVKCFCGGVATHAVMYDHGRRGYIEGRCAECTGAHQPCGPAVVFASQQAAFPFQYEAIAKVFSEAQRTGNGYLVRASVFGGNQKHPLTIKVGTDKCECGAAAKFFLGPAPSRRSCCEPSGLQSSVALACGSCAAAQKYTPRDQACRTICPKAPVAVIGKYGALIAAGSKPTREAYLCKVCELGSKLGRGKDKPAPQVPHGHWALHMRSNRHQKNIRELQIIEAAERVESEADTSAEDTVMG